METQEEFAVRWTAEYHLKRARLAKWVLELRTVKKKNRERKEIQPAQKFEKNETGDMRINWNHPRMREALRIYFVDNLRFRDMTNFQENEAPMDVDINPDFWPDVMGILKQLQSRDLAVDYGMGDNCQLFRTTEIDDRVTSPYSQHFEYGSHCRRSCMKSNKTIHVLQRLMFNRSKTVTFVSAKIMLYIQTNDEEVWKVIPFNMDLVDIHGKMIRDISIKEMKKEYTGHLDAECNSKFSVIVLSSISQSKDLYSKMPPIRAKMTPGENELNKDREETPEPIQHGLNLISKKSIAGTSSDQLNLENPTKDGPASMGEEISQLLKVEPTIGANIDTESFTAKAASIAQSVDNNETKYLESINTACSPKGNQAATHQQHYQIHQDTPTAAGISVQSNLSPVSKDKISKTCLSDGNQLNKSQESLCSEESLQKAIDEILCDEDLPNPRRRNSVRNWQAGSSMGGGDIVQDVVNICRLAGYRRDEIGAQGYTDDAIKQVKSQYERQNVGEGILTGHQLTKEALSNQAEVNTPRVQTGSDSIDEKALTTQTKSSTSISICSATGLETHSAEQQRKISLFGTQTERVPSPDENIGDRRCPSERQTEVPKGTLDVEAVPHIGQVPSPDNRVIHYDTDYKTPPESFDTGLTTETNDTPPVKLRRHNKLLRFIRRRASHLKSKLQCFYCCSNNPEQN